MIKLLRQTALLWTIQVTGILLIVGSMPSVAQVALYGRHESVMQVDGSCVHLDVTASRITQHTPDAAISVFGPVDVEVSPRLKLTYTDPATDDLHRVLHPGSVADAMTERLAWSTGSRYPLRDRSIITGIVRDSSLYYAGIVADMSELNAQTGLPGSPFDSVPAVAPEPNSTTAVISCFLAAIIVSLIARRKVARRA